jgi:segregation and condensation protein B
MTDNTSSVDEITDASSTPENEQEPERVVIFEEALEAILFAAGHPISYATLGRVFDMTPAKVKDKVFEYSIKYNDPEIARGVILLTFSDSCQLCTKQYYLAEIREALGIKKSGSLSTSSMEALAIIAYNQPVTRVFVDTLRRVDSSYAMNNLLDRGLIESKGRMDAPGRPMLYGTTQDFLRCFGLKDLSALPRTSDELMEVFDKAKIAESDANAEAESDMTEALEEIIDEGEIENAPQIEIELEEPSADDDIVNDEI